MHKNVFGLCLLYQLTSENISNNKKRMERTKFAMLCAWISALIRFWNFHLRQWLVRCVVFIRFSHCVDASMINQIWCTRISFRFYRYKPLTINYAMILFFFSFRAIRRNYNIISNFCFVSFQMNREKQIRTRFCFVLFSDVFNAQHGCILVCSLLVFKLLCFGC